jgi:thymidylate kinase
MNKKIIWIAGGMGSGKSTQRRNICNFFSNNYKVVKSDDYIFTSFGKLASIGETSESSNCDGLDRSFGKLKKDGAIKSIEVAIKQFDFVIIEGSQTSFNFIEPINKIAKDFNADFYFVHLYLDDDERHRRIHKRSGKDIEKIRTINNDKVKQFKNIYQKIKSGNLIKNHLEINCMKSEKKVFVEIMKFIFL